MLKRGSLLFPINNNTVYGSELTHPAPVFYQKNIGKQQIIVQKTPPPASRDLYAWKWKHYCHLPREGLSSCLKKGVWSRIFLQSFQLCSSSNMYCCGCFSYFACIGITFQNDHLPEYIATSTVKTSIDGFAHFQSGPTCKCRIRAVLRVCASINTGP